MYQDTGKAVVLRDIPGVAGIVGRYETWIGVGGLGLGVNVGRCGWTGTI